jgi:hypothetical protein
VGALITSEEYERERKVCAGTRFHTPAFCEMSEEWFEKDMRKKMSEEQMKDFLDQGYDTMWFLRTPFNGYSRTLFIDTGIGDIKHYLELTREFAAKLEIGMRAATEPWRLSRTVCIAQKSLSQHKWIRIFRPSSSHSISPD